MQATPISGTSADDVYVAKLSADGLFLQIWTSADTSGAPAYSISTSNTVSLNLGAGNDTLLLDLSIGANLSLALSGIETIQLTTPTSANLALSTSAISVNSTTISCSGASLFQLNTRVLNTLTLAGNISLKLANPNLIVNSGAIPALRSYLANAATGANPRLLAIPPPRSHFWIIPSSTKQPSPESLSPPPSPSSSSKAPSPAT